MLSFMCCLPRLARGSNLRFAVSKCFDKFKHHQGTIYYSNFVYGYIDFLEKFIFETTNIIVVVPWRRNQNGRHCWSY